MSRNENTPSIYTLVGGDETFKKLVDVFYDRIANDTYLRGMFPEDLDEGKQWQYLFLVQFFGGPPEYHIQRGHPRLRMRHAPFAIDQEARDRWLGHMLDSIDAVGIEEPARSFMQDYFERASAHMINTYDPSEKDS